MLRLTRSSWQRPGWLQNNDNQAVYPGKAHFTIAEMYYRQSQNQALNAGDGKDTPVSSSLPSARCFTLPIASFVIRSENSEVIQSEKPEMSQQYRIIASFLNQRRQGPLAIATSHNSRALFIWKVNKFPNVGLIKSKDMIKFKPGRALNRSYFSHWFL